MSTPTEGPTRIRLDRAVVDRGLVPSRARAQRLIDAGAVLIDGRPETRASALVGPEHVLSLQTPDLRYVSRGGLKLEQALQAFGVDPTGLRCLDVGASTGGFTDCLLQHGAQQVIAVDVGTDQLHPTLRTDPRVVSFEQTDIRKLELPATLTPVDLIVVDCSFIAVAQVMPDALRFARAGTRCIVLIKPQFEAGRQAIRRGGVVRDARLREKAILQARQALEALALRVLGGVDCDTAGPAGNVEYLLFAEVRHNAIDAAR